MFILGAIASSVQNGAFESIATITGNGSATTLTFNSIPSTYQHLQIRALFWDASGNEILVRFNGDNGSNYARHRLLGNGSSAATSSAASQTSMRVGYAPALTPGCASIIDIHDYTSNSKNKTLRAFSGWTYQPTDTVGRVILDSGLWMSTNSITSISFASPNSFTTSTTFALYGIKGA